MKDIVIGIDAGTSVIKSVAFTLAGKQLADFAIANTYETLAGGGVEQDPARTWADTAKTLQGLCEAIPDLPDRLSAIAVTGQGDGTWLIDKHAKPVGNAWLWLDGRAGSIVESFNQGPHQKTRFHETGTGFAACQQSAHWLWMKEHAPELLKKSAAGFHCKDWLYMNLTGEQVTDPTEACFTFGNFRTLEYSDTVLDVLQLQDCEHLLPPVLDGINHAHPLTEQAAKATGLVAGTPVVLAYVDVICSALGAGLYDSKETPGCTIVGSTGIHMKLIRGADQVVLNDECTGFTMPMPVAGVYTQLQSNLASTLNIDWILDIAVEVLASQGTAKERRDLLPAIDQWIAQSTPADLIYQPYILEAGERGPMISNTARAGFIGLNTRHGFASMVTSVIEGLALAGRDCYSIMGDLPDEIRVTGGAARSESLRKIFGNVLGARLRPSNREEVGAAGAAMMATVSIGHYDSMDDCVVDWVTPTLGDVEDCDPALTKRYDSLFPAYVEARNALQPVWKKLQKHGENT